MPSPKPVREHSGGRSPAHRRLLQVGLFAVPLAVLAVGAWSHRAMLDDSFINLRVVTQILHGNGPVLNQGQRVEAVTSPLWLWVLVLGDVVLPLRLEWIAIVLDIAGALGGVALLMAGSARLFHRQPDGSGGAGTGGRVGFVVPLGALVLVCFTPMWIYSATGLENGLSTLWLGASLFVLAGWANRDADERGLGLWSAVLLGLGPLVRPELAVFTVLFLPVAAVLERGRGWRRVLAVVAAGVALPLGYQVFRMGYYGSIMPSSAVAKSATKTRWDAGWDYLTELLRGHWLWVPLLVAVAGALVPTVGALWAGGRLDGRRRVDRRLVVAGLFVGGGLLNTLFIVRVGGDYLPARLLLPALTAIVAPVAVVPWNRRYALAGLVLPWAVAGAGLLRTNADHLLFFSTSRRNPVTLADFNWHSVPGTGLPPSYQRPGVYLNLTWIAPPQPGHPQRVVAEYGIGVSGYGLGVRTEVVDLLGLGDPLAAHLRLAQRGVNSHEKPLPLPWLVARELTPGTAYDPSRLVTGPGQREPLVFLLRQLGHPTEPFPQRVAAARRALDCGPIRRLVLSYTGRLTPRKFLSNLVHAASYTTFEIPPEPSDAVARLCPAGR